MSYESCIEQLIPWRLRRRWRRVSAPVRMLPHYLIIGAQKGGTDSLSVYLESHPQVLPAARKEIFYFDSHYYRGIDWYRQWFPLTPIRRHRWVTGEATPDYLVNPFAAERIAATLPEARLIVLLRDPVARAWSHFHHAVRWKFEHLSFAEAISEEPRRLAGEMEKMRTDPKYISQSYRHFSYIERGRYAGQLRRYYDWFDREQILVVRSEDFFTDPQTVFDRILCFLRLEPWQIRDKQPRNTGKYSRTIAEAEPTLAADLYDYFRPANDDLSRLLGHDMAWPSSAGQAPAMSSSCQG